LGDCQASCLEENDDVEIGPWEDYGCSRTTSYFPRLKCLASGLRNDILFPVSLHSPKGDLMPNRTIVFTKGEHYHIFNRGNNSQKIFLTAENYFSFLDRLSDRLPPSSVRIHSFSLLPNHFHLSIKLDEDFDLSNAMKYLQQSYARNFNKKYRRHGHVFESPFKALRIETQDYLDFLSRYIHRNPVEAGFATTPEAWQFSSYRSYVGGTPIAIDGHIKGTSHRKTKGWSLPNIDTAATLSRFQTVEDYRSFVMTDWERYPWQLANGVWAPMGHRKM
jgi:putative transposase